MKHLFNFLFLTLAISAFCQTEIMDSIEQVRREKEPELAKSFCTNAYWLSENDGGGEVFESICKWPPEVQLKLNKEQKNDNRSVLTVDFYRNNKLRDRIYIYLEYQSGKWLIDGFNETEKLVQHYLDGYYTGHFSPKDLPNDKMLEKLGREIVSYGQNETEVRNYLLQNTTSDSEFGFVGQLVDNSFKPHTFVSAGFDKRLNKGYIHLKGEDKEINSYYSHITIYLTKTRDNKIEILSQNYSRPWASSFFE